LHTGGEIARIEIPAWVAEDTDQVNLVHGIVLDQVRKGNGYPIALTEAHQLAVVRPEEREFFLNLLSLAMEQQGVPPNVSAKYLSKRRAPV
ncbi:MAG: DNA double-strand break repair nuclease NurA, partial [Armatimonadetes bacterium]|nr:DNA double-strand break repair nuclease NurA [Armatimonadota bacterium]MDW8123116.1 DNA double-strand break repair nuclease NurA [Armatimonadota bacterium]